MTDNKTATATASATATLPLATVLVVLLAVAKTQNLWDLGDLSWWWVFAPYWLGFVVLIGFLLIFGIIAGIVLGVASLIDASKAKKRRKAAAERLKR